MRRIAAAIAATLVIMYVVTFFVYGIIAAITGLEPPEDGSAMQFLFGVLITKLGLALGFVLLFALAREARHGRWLLSPRLPVMSAAGAASPLAPAAPDWRWRLIRGR